MEDYSYSGNDWIQVQFKEKIVGSRYGLQWKQSDKDTVYRGKFGLRYSLQWKSWMKMQFTLEKSDKDTAYRGKFG